MFRYERRYIRGPDLASCRVETPMLSTCPRHGYPRFNMPTALARAIGQAGWDFC